VLYLERHDSGVVDVFGSLMRRGDRSDRSYVLGLRLQPDPAFNNLDASDPRSADMAGASGGANANVILDF
jgi:hypothetical protein